MLQVFLNRIARHPILSNEHVFHRFLERDVSWVSPHLHLTTLILTPPSPRSCTPRPSPSSQRTFSKLPPTTRLSTLPSTPPSPSPPPHTPSAAQISASSIRNLSPRNSKPTSLGHSKKSPAAPSNAGPNTPTTPPSSAPRSMHCPCPSPHTRATR